MLEEYREEVEFRPFEKLLYGKICKMVGIEIDDGDLQLREGEDLAERLKNAKQNGCIKVVDKPPPTVQETNTTGF